MSEQQARPNVPELIGAIWPVGLLLGARRAGVFEALAEQPGTLEDIMERLGTQRRPTRIVLDALSALQLLKKEGTRYRLHPEARDWLVAGRPDSQAHRMDHLSYMWEAWGRLAEVMRTGKPAQSEPADETDKQRRMEAFIGAMQEVGQASAETLADRLCLQGVRRVLDVGGGPGAYCIALARRKPDLQLTLLDRQAALDVARGYVEAAGLAQRIELRPGDATVEEYGGPFDLIVISQLFHAYDEATNQAMMARAARALAVGGRVVVNEFALQADRMSPSHAALFAVNMLVNTEAGRSYTIGEIEAWMRNAGLEPETRETLLERSTVFIGRK